MSECIDYRKTRFVLSAPDIAHLPCNQGGVEVAFAGRSNSGKSSALNALCDNRRLAKTSNTPGRTRLINLFEVQQGFYLVDLPGYGYAKVSDSIKRQWQKALAQYLQERVPLRGLVVTMDIRHPLQEHDRTILDWTLAANLPVMILLTKADKLSASQRAKAVLQTEFALREFGGSFTVIPFSALRKFGIDEARAVLCSWHAVLARD